MGGRGGGSGDGGVEKVGKFRNLAHFEHKNTF